MKYSIYAIRWMIFFTALCLILNLSLIVFQPCRYYYYADFVRNLPFYQWSILIFGCLCFMFRLPIIKGIWVFTETSFNTWPMSGDVEYIKANYPKLFNTLYPFNDRANFTMTNLLNFIRGEYDDGLDPNINKIKLKFLIFIVFIIWTFLLHLIILITKIIFTLLYRLLILIVLNFGLLAGLITLLFIFFLFYKFFIKYLIRFKKVGTIENLLNSADFDLKILNFIKKG